MFSILSWIANMCYYEISFPFWRIMFASVSKTYKHFLELCVVRCFWCNPYTNKSWSTLESVRLFINYLKLAGKVLVKSAFCVCVFDSLVIYILIIHLWLQLMPLPPSPTPCPSGPADGPWPTAAAVVALTVGAPPPRPCGRPYTPHGCCGCSHIASGSVPNEKGAPKTLLRSHWKL